MPDAPLMIGISGLRGHIGASLTPPLVVRYAAAIGACFRAAAPAGTPHARLVLGRDSRPSGQMIELAAAAGLVATGAHVTCLGIASTPAVAVAAVAHHAHGGLVITASHNPIIWNGVKALRHDGVAPPPEQARDIIDRFHADRVDYAPVENLLPLTHDDTAAAVHVRRVLEQVDVPLIRKARLKVVVDSVHGAGGPEAALLLDELGVERVHLYAEPTGRFPHPPEPVREHLTELAAAVRQHGAAVGFAQDPDADRLALVDDRGVYIGEEYTLALGALHVLARSAAAVGEKRCVAANLSTSRMLDDIAAAAGVTVIRTPVGEANVAAAMQKHGCIVGGEGNGGVILPPVTLVRDSLVGMALVLELIAQRGKPLSAITAEVPSYAIVKQKMDVQPGLAPRLPELLGNATDATHVDTQDGVRLDWPDRWVHVRPSNTEPIIRVIAEARDESTANKLIARVRDVLAKA